MNFNKMKIIMTHLICFRFISILSVTIPFIRFTPLPIIKLFKNYFIICFIYIVPPDHFILNPMKINYNQI